MFRISQLAEKTGKTKRALRFYEELGILTPSKRTDSGYRMYSKDAVSQVEWIDKLHQLGFSLPDIQSFLADFNNLDNGPERMSVLRTIYEQKLLEAHQQIQRLQDLSLELQESLDYLSLCTTCAASTSAEHCSGCNKHERQSPMLISVVTNSTMVKQ